MYPCPSDRRLRRKESVGTSVYEFLCRTIYASPTHRPFSLMPLLQSLLGPHKLPYTNWDIRKEVPSTQSSSPVCLTASSIIVHTRTILCALMLHTHHPRLAALRGPFLDFIAVLVPYAIDTAGHAAVVRLRRARGDEYASDQGRFTVYLGAALSRTCKPRSEDNSSFLDSLLFLCLE